MSLQKDLDDLAAFADMREPPGVARVRRIADAVDAIREQARQAIALLADDECQWEPAMRLLFPIAGLEWEDRSVEAFSLSELFRHATAAEREKT